MLSVKLRRHKPTRFFSDELQALITYYIVVGYAHTVINIVHNVCIVFASSDLYTK